jgi:hypothetical protein
VINLRDFARGGPRDTDRVIVIDPVLQPRIAVLTKPQGWVSLELFGLIIYGAKSGCGKDSAAIVDSAHRRYIPKPPALMSRPLYPMIGMWLTADNGYVVNLVPAIYFTVLGYGDMIIREMGLTYNSIDECKGWKGQLPVEGRKLSHKLLLQKHREIA